MVLANVGDGMFLEKHSRFFRHYQIELAPRHSSAARIQLNAAAPQLSIREALEAVIHTDAAVEVQPNGDLIELMQVDYSQAHKALVCFSTGPALTRRTLRIGKRPRGKVKKL